MNLYAEIKIENTQALLEVAVEAAKDFSYFSILNNNDLNYGNDDGQFDFLMAFGAADILNIKNGKGNSFEELHRFHHKNDEIIFGHLSYDLKNELEKLSSKGIDGVRFPLMTFFVPRVMLMIKSGLMKVYISEREGNTAKDVADKFLFELKKRYTGKERVSVGGTGGRLQVKQRMSKEEYFEKFEKIKEHIRHGDIYEMNFCMESYAEEVELNPFEFYLKYNKVSPAPFSAFYRVGEHFLISGSPERYLKKTGRRIISQPIKGTAPRHPDAERDAASKENLKNSLKERAENVMIVDLVRNDLSRTAKSDSVKVEELCGIYSFRQVHQMISTVSSLLDEKYDFVDVLKTTFPMGSMTGAPKIRAMELIEEYEDTRRGLYSGAVGYIDSKGDFDFNVVIRSVLYNAGNKYLSFITGGAVTSRSLAADEYNECLLKAKGIFEAIGS